MDFEIIDREIEKFLREKDKQGIKPACKKGCNYCCKKVPLLISLGEVVAIVDKLNTLNKVQKKNIINAMKKLNRRFGPITGTHKDITDIKSSRALNVNYQCAFLVGNICTVYDVRPLLCRAYMSSNKEFCKNGPGDMLVTISGEVQKKIYIQGFDIKNTTLLQCHAHRAILYKNGKFIFAGTEN